MNRLDRAAHEDARLALALLMTPGIGPRRLAALLVRTSALGLKAGDFVGDYGSARLDDLGVAAASQVNLRRQLDSAEALLRRLGESGITMLRPEHQPYPAVSDWPQLPRERTYPVQLLSTLGSAAPPLLFAAGDLDLLLMPGVGFCGSRDPSERALTAVSVTANQLARTGFNVISGYARGVDQAAHSAALRAGGSTTMVLAEGILNFRAQKELGGLVNDHNTLVLSEFPPTSRWSVGNAMKRNETICALADALVIVEARMSGGTYAAGQSALKFGRPLFVVDYGSDSEIAPGNRYFLDRGAQPLRRTRDSRDPSTSTLISAALQQARRDDYRAQRTGSDDWNAEPSRVSESGGQPLTLWETSPIAGRRQTSKDVGRSKRSAARSG